MHKQYTSRCKKGFTLIEVMVVVSIISLLSSIVLAFLTSAKKSAMDSVSVTELQSLRTAAALYRMDTGKFPDLILHWDYITPGGGTIQTRLPDGSWPPGRQPNTWVCDRTWTNGPGQAVMRQAYDAAMQPFVDAGYLAEIPHSHPGTNPYCFFNYDMFPTLPSNFRFALFSTTLLTPTPSIVGPYNSFRFTQAEYPGNWKNDRCGTEIANTDYCIKVD